MKIAIASDHRGVELKSKLIEYLKNEGHEVKDFGPSSSQSVDYPDYVIPAAKEVAEGKCDKGIVICNTGIGVSIAANKVKGAYAALCLDEEYAMMSRKHNNANIIAMGASRVSFELAKKMVDIFLKEEFEGGRHERRINKIKKVELE